MDEEKEASEAPFPRVITKDMNSASKTRTQGTVERTPIKKLLIV